MSLCCFFLLFFFLQSASGTTPFLYLVAHPCSDLLLFIAHLMLKRGTDPNAANEHGLTPLHNACLRAGEGNVLFLLLNGANGDLADKYEDENPSLFR